MRLSMTDFLILPQRRKSNTVFLTGVCSSYLYPSMKLALM